LEFRRVLFRSANPPSGIAPGGNETKTTSLFVAALSRLASTTRSDTMPVESGGGSMVSKASRQLMVHALATPTASAKIDPRHARLLMAPLRHSRTPPSRSDAPSP